MEALDADVPILGVCLGHQLIVHWLGGKVKRGRWEIGWLPVTVNAAGQADPLLAGLGQRFHAFLWHGDQVTQLPEGAELLASSELCRVQAYRLRGRPVWGVQFNPQYDPVIAESTTRHSPWITDFGWDVEEIVATGYREYDDLADRIFGNFLEYARGEGIHATPVATTAAGFDSRHLEPR
jgi:GMP synthase-like glutamine amidotransferase